jgi:hypothetical protein
MVKICIKVRRRRRRDNRDFNKNIGIEDYSQIQIRKAGHSICLKNVILACPESF